MLGLSRLLRRKPAERQWKFSAWDLPWLDRPDAMERIEERRKNGQLSDADFERLRQWIIEGYFIVDAPVDFAIIDAMFKELEDVWDRDEALPGAIIGDLRLELGGRVVNMPHDEMVTLSKERRREIRKISRWKVYESYRCSPHGAMVRDHAELRRLAALLMDRPCDADFTMNYFYGSCLGTHQDAMGLFLWPPAAVVGGWLACEDISPDAGPLYFFPKSHKEPIYKGFPNYPATNCKTANKETAIAYGADMQTLSEKFERKQFLGKKGQMLFYHGMLLHGGDKVNDETLTRKSWICHYIPPGMRMDHMFKGPFNF